MSRGFVKEYENQWLNEIAPTMGALVQYLTRENNEIRVYEKRTYTNPVDGKEIHEMSNGVAYSINSENEWYMLD